MLDAIAMSLVVGAGPAGSAAAVPLAGRPGATSSSSTRRCSPRQVLRRRADDARAARARGARVRPGGVADWYDVDGAVLRSPSRPRGPRAAADRRRARTPPSRRGCSSTTRSSTSPARPGPTVLAGPRLRRLDRRSTATTSSLGVDGHGPSPPLRRRRRRDVEPGAQGARPRRARLPRRVARLPPVRPRRRPAPPPSELFVWFDADLLPGYAWSFPLPGGRANIGFGVLRDGSRRSRT